MTIMQSAGLCGVGTCRAVLSLVGAVHVLTMSA